MLINNDYNIKAEVDCITLSKKRMAKVTVDGKETGELKEVFDNCGYFPTYAMCLKWLIINEVQDVTEFAEIVDKIEKLEESLKVLGVEILDETHKENTRLNKIIKGLEKGEK